MPQSIALLTPAIGTGNVGDEFIERAIRRLLHPDTRFCRFSVRQPLTDRDLGQINETTAAVLCGTNLYQHAWSLALDPPTLERIKVPVVPFGIGGSARELNDFEVSRQTREMIIALHAHCEIGGVRDPFSADVVEKAGVRNILMTGCPVLYWAGRPALPLPAAISRRRVILTARNFLMHRWPDSVDQPVQIELMRQLLAGLSGYEVRFAIHEPYDRNLVSLLDIDPAILLESDSADDYLPVYTEPAHVVLAMRLHAGMLALANGLPVVFVGHDTRTYSFCQMLGLDWVELFAPDCAAQCLERLRNQLAGQTSLPSPVEQRFVRCRHSMQQFLAANRLQGCSP